MKLEFAQWDNVAPPKQIKRRNPPPPTQTERASGPPPLSLFLVVCTAAREEVPVAIIDQILHIYYSLHSTPKQDTSIQIHRGRITSS